MRAVILALSVAAATAVLAVPAAHSENQPIQAFYGEFEGRTLFPMGEPRNRELLVVIRPEGRFGFAVDWQTTIHKAHKKAVRRDQSLVFEPTARANIYFAPPPADGRSPSPDNGGSRAYGPVNGTPYAWARILGGTLTVNVFTIDEEGDYVVQSYNRTLTEKGMRLEFTRVRDGQIEQQIKGDLARIGG